MKNTVLKSVLAIVMAFMALPMMGQDFMNVFFKDGDFRKFYMKNITEITTSKFDAYGVQHSDIDYQHITTIYDKYVYSLKDVDSITFTKIDEELAEQNFASAMSAVFPILSSCSTIGDAAKSIEQIKNAEGVADAWCDGHELHMAIKEGEVISFHFNHDVTEETDMEYAASHIKSILPKMETVIKRDGKRLKAVIANQQHKDEDRSKNITKFFEPLKAHFELCNVDVDYIEEPTVEFFDSQIYDYDIVFYITHGSYGNMLYYSYSYLGIDYAKIGIKCHSFQTSEDLDFDKSEGKESHDNPNWIDKYRKFKKWRDEKPWKDVTDVHINFGFAHELRDGKWYWYAHPNLTEHFFRDISSGSFKNPNSIFFNVACQSLMGEDEVSSLRLADKFFKKNLGIYIGYDETNWSGQQNGYNFFKSMLNGNSFRKAIDDIEIVKREDWETDIDGDGIIDKWITNFLYKTNPYHNVNEDIFLSPTITEAREQNELSDEYKLNDCVNVEGVTTILEEGCVTMGFKYGTDINDLSKISFGDRIPSIVETPYAPNYGKGNVRFKGALYDLEPGNTYYYCAFTYDGFNYNYGDTLSFYIDGYSEFTISTNSVSLNVGWTRTVDITSGSGSYVVESSDEFVATAFVDGNTISINALNPGEATITVSDKVSGQTQTIKVTVTGQAATRELMVTKTVNKTVYSLYKKTLDENNYRTNPDGWRCYRSELVLDIIKDGSTESYVIDNNIYLDKKNSHHTGQHPCLLLDFNKNMIGVFCNSKESGSNYDMDGYYYSSSMSNINFSKETVFEGYNWGWFPYFRDYGDDNVNLCNFSYDGNFTILAVRASGSWDLYYDNKDISPDAAQQIWERIGSVLVIGKTQDDEVDDRIHTVIPEEIRDVIDEYIPIYDGMNPPNIEGSYYLSPQILIGSSLSYDQIGKEYSAEYQKYGNQDMEKNTIDMVRVQGGGTEWDKGSGAFISGTGNNFTIYFDMAGESRYTNDSGVEISVPTKMAYIVSGTKTSSGIKNLTVGFVMKEKGYDPDEMIVDVGTFRFFTDQDGMCEATSWPYGNQYGTKKRVKQGNALPNSLDKNREKLTPLK